MFGFRRMLGHGECAGYGDGKLRCHQRSVHDQRPSRATVHVHGITYTGTQTLTVASGSYLLSTTTPQSTGVGTQAAFTSWSDGGAIAHNISLTLPVQSITGSFTTQYLLTALAQPLGAGTVAPAAGGLYFNPGSVVTVAESPNAGFGFTFWSGACSGAGTCVVTLNAPKSVTGNFAGAMKWVQLGPLHTPSGRDGAGMVYDAACAETVLFGGETVVNTVFSNETWTWNGVDWTLKTPPNSPPARVSFAMAYDPIRGETVLFGGAVSMGGGGFVLSSETWTWDGTNWTQRFPAPSPPARFETRMAWDGTRLILFGGSGTASLLQDTWAWDGSNWTLLNPASRPAGRFYHTMTYDAARNQIMLFGGQSTSGRVNDTWIWTGANWIQQNPLASPPPGLTQPPHTMR